MAMRPNYIGYFEMLNIMLSSVSFEKVLLKVVKKFVAKLGEGNMMFWILGRG